MQLKQTTYTRSVVSLWPTSVYKYFPLSRWNITSETSHLPCIFIVKYAEVMQVYKYIRSILSMFDLLVFFFYFSLPNKLDWMIFGHDKPCILFISSGVRKVLKRLFTSFPPNNNNREFLALCFVRRWVCYTQKWFVKVEFQAKLAVFIGLFYPRPFWVN